MSVCVDLKNADEMPADSSRPPSLPGNSTSIIRAEANLLRFPLFALHTKGIRSLDGIRCSGRQQRGAQTVHFTFTATRNTSTFYPGPLARSAHLAFLSLLTEAGSPAPQPITWTWRDLCRRMGIVYGGEIVRDLKRAITSTAGLLIHSESALFSKSDAKRISTREEALHLYDRVAFVGSALPDGSEADQNYLWLSDWYRQNLDAYFTAPLDFALWKHLDERSSIASRLYEFLLVNFYSSAPVLRLNYETLTQYLPVKAEKYLSSARRQLGPAIELLKANAIIASADWCASKAGLSQIILERGQRFAQVALPAVAHTLPAGEEATETVAVEELRNQRPPEWFLVSDFYRDYATDLLHRPSPKELTLARELLAKHGVAQGRAIVTAAVKRLKLQWPEAKTFGAIAVYLPDAIKDCEQRSRRAERERQAQLADQTERASATLASEDQEALRVRWKSLAETDREGIRATVLAQQPRSIQKFPSIVERFCLQELARRNAGQITTPLPPTQ